MIQFVSKSRGILFFNLLSLLPPDIRCLIVVLEWFEISLYILILIPISSFAVGMFKSRCRISFDIYQGTFVITLNILD